MKPKLILLWLILTLVILCVSLLSFTRKQTAYCGPTADCLLPNGTIIKQYGFPFPMMEGCDSLDIGFPTPACEHPWYDWSHIVENFIVIGGGVAGLFVLQNRLWHNKAKHKH